MKLKYIPCIVGVWMAVTTATSVLALEPLPSVPVTVESPGGEFFAFGYKEEGINPLWEKKPRSRISFPLYHGGYVKIYSKTYLLHFACIWLARNGTPFMEYHTIPNSCGDKPRYIVDCKLDKKKTYLCTYHPNETFSH